MRQNDPAPHTDSPETEITHHGAPLAIVAAGFYWARRGSTREMTVVQLIQLQDGVVTVNFLGTDHWPDLDEAIGEGMELLERIERSPEKTPERSGCEA